MAQFSGAGRRKVKSAQIPIFQNSLGSKARSFIFLSQYTWVLGNTLKVKKISANPTIFENLKISTFYGVCLIGPNLSMHPNSSKPL